jgi:regulator of protease activity HflC (stomatin/prohibitin superfamily)
VNNFQLQIVNLARTTLRNIIGTLTLKSAKSERGKINAELYKTLHNETQTWGTELVNIIGEMAGIVPLMKNKKD